jgi:hypothetical protein
LKSLAWAVMAMGPDNTPSIITIIALVISNLLLGTTMIRLRAKTH